MHCFEPILKEASYKEQLYSHLPPISQTIQEGEQDLMSTAGEVRTVL